MSLRKMYQLILTISGWFQDAVSPSFVRTAAFHAVPFCVILISLSLFALILFCCPYFSCLVFAAPCFYAYFAIVPFSSPLISLSLSRYPYKRYFSQRLIMPLLLFWEACINFFYFLNFVFGNFCTPFFTRPFTLKNFRKFLLSPSTWENFRAPSFLPCLLLKEFPVPFYSSFFL